MAIILEVNYSKKSGLPGSSRHQFGLTLRVEIADPSQIHAESSRLYALLQPAAVDQSLQQSGWLPPAYRGWLINGQNHHGKGNASGWSSSERQCRRIMKIMDQLRWDLGQMEKLAQQSFGRGLRQLNKPEASRLIQKLLQIKAVLKRHPEIRRTHSHQDTVPETNPKEHPSAPGLNSAADERIRIPEKTDGVEP